MREFTDIYRDYLAYMYQTTGRREYIYDVFMESHDPQVAKAFLYKTILQSLYDKENGLFYFCKFIIGDLKELGYPKPFRYNTLLRRWDKLTKRYKKLCIEASRGHGKSLFFSTIFNIFDMSIHKHRKVLIESSNQEQADIILAEIARIVDNNEWLLRLKDKDNWRAGMLGFNGGFMLGKGFGSEVLGLHLDRIIIDDILRSDNKLTDIEIEDFIDMTLDPMLLNRDGQMILVGTPKSDSDIFSTVEQRAKENGSWYFERFPAILDYDKKILQCPDRFTWGEIMNKRLSMGPLKFAREYQLEFFSRDTSLFPTKAVKIARDKGKDMVLLNKIDVRDASWTFVGGIDVARSGSVSADWTVCFILAYNTITQAKQIAYMWRKKGLKITEQASQIAEISRAFRHPYFLVEQNNMGQDMIDELVDNYNLNIDAFITGGKGQKKDELIRFLITSFEHEQIVMPNGDDESRDSMNILEEELSKFCVTYTPTGNEQFKGVGGKDDCVMALALANRATQSMGIPFVVATGGGSSSTNPYTSLIKSIGNKQESDLVNQIRLGLIK